MGLDLLGQEAHLDLLRLELLLVDADLQRFHLVHHVVEAAVDAVELSALFLLQNPVVQVAALHGFNGAVELRHRVYDPVLHGQQQDRQGDHRRHGQNLQQADGEGQRAADLPIGYQFQGIELPGGGSRGGDQIALLPDLLQAQLQIQPPWQRFAGIEDPALPVGKGQDAPFRQRNLPGDVRQLDPGAVPDAPMLAHGSQHGPFAHGEQAAAPQGRAGTFPNLLQDPVPNRSRSDGVTALLGKHLLFWEIGEDPAD